MESGDATRVQQQAHGPWRVTRFQPCPPSRNCSGLKSKRSIQRWICIRALPNSRATALMLPSQANDATVRGND